MNINLITNLQLNGSLKEELVNHYAEEGTFCISKFLEDLQQAIQNQSRVDRLEFASLAELKLPEENKICRLGLYILLGKDLEGVDIAIAQEIADCTPEERKRILQVLEELGSHQYIKEAISFVKSINKDENPDTLLEELHRISSDRRVDVIVKFTELFKGMNGTWLYAKIKVLSILARLSDQERQDVFDRTVPLFKQVFLGQENILETIAQIPIDQRDEVLRIADPLLKGILNGEFMGIILRCIHQTPPNQRQEVMDCTITLLEKIQLLYDRFTVMEVIYQTFRENQETFHDLIAQAQLLFEIADSHQSVILENLIKIPTAQRQNILDQAMPLLKGQACGREQAAILNAIYHMDPDQRMDVITKTCFLMIERDEGIVNENVLKILKFLNQISPDERQGLIDAAAPLLKEIKSGDEVKAILAAVNHLPANQRADYIEKFKPCLPDIKDGRLRAFFLRLIYQVKDMPQDQVNEVFSQIKAFFIQIGDSDGWEKKQVIKIILSAPVTHILGLTQVFPLFEGMQGCKGEILKGFMEIPVDQRGDIVKHASLLYVDLRNEVQRMAILKILHHTPADQRQDQVDRLVRILNIIKNLPSDKNLRFVDVFFKFERVDILDVLDKLNLEIPSNILQSLSLIPPEKIEEALELLNQNPKAHIFEQPAIREASYVYLQQRLEADLTFEDKLLWANQIVNEQDTLGLQEEHPLWQMVIQTLSICDPKALKNPKNPYHLYTFLQKILASEPLMEIESPWNLDPLRQTIGEVNFPEGVDPEILTQQFGALQSRLNELPDEKRQEIEQYIASRTAEDSVAELRSNLLDKPFISRLLKQDGGYAKAQLLWILKALSDAVATRQEGELLSPQEEMLLSISTSIQACITGQREGLSEFYQNLPVNYRPLVIKEGGAVVNALYTCMQQALHDLLGDKKLLKTLITGSMKELSHHVLFLKNRFHKQLGLQHQLTFDPHTGTLHDHLVDLVKKDPQKILSDYLNHLSPEVVAQRFIKDSESLFKSNTIWPEPLVSLLQQAEIQRTGSLTNDYLNDYIEFEEDEACNYYPLRLKELGVLALLKVIDYLKTV